jgi:hypothetical protein
MLEVNYRLVGGGKQVDTSADTPRAIANYCGRPERNGKGWKANCPICGRHSLCVTPKLEIIVYCFHCVSIGLNNGHTPHCELFVEKGLLDPGVLKIKLDREKLEKQNAERRAEAEAIWESDFRKPLTPDCLAGKYLRARGLESFIGHPALSYFAGAFFKRPSDRCTRYLPRALMSRVVHAHHGVSAVQWTFLLDDGSDRNRELKRRTEGVLAGGGVWIGSPNPDEWMGVAEGLETLLSAMKLLGLKCGAAVLGSNLKGLELPPTARRVHICADNDDRGRPVADAAYKFWRAEGRHVRVSMPSTEGWDFNNELLGK